MSASRGDSGRVRHVVGTADTARAVGSGEVEVLATPIVLAWCEEASCAALDLPENTTSVGTRVSIEHLLPSAIGTAVIAEATVTAVDGRMVTFEVVARDEAERMIAHGEVRRIVVDRERFAARVPGVGD